MKDKIKQIKFLIGLDCETTGLKAHEGSITEIGICLWNCRTKCPEENRVVAVYSELYKPEEKISKFIREKTGIWNKGVKNLRGHTFNWYDALLNWLIKYGKEIPIVGHNLSFDRSHLMANRVKLFQEHRLYYDTMKQLPRVGRKYIKLVDAIKKYLPKDSIHKKSHHRALNDAIMGCALAQVMLVNKVNPISETDLLKK